MTVRDITFRAPLQLAVAAGATTPNPGQAGVIVWSTATGSHLIWNGTSWAALGGGASGPAYVPVSGTVSVNCGSAPVDQATLTVSAPTVTANSVVLLALSPAGTADHPADEAAVEALTFAYANVVPGVGFDIALTCTDTFGLTGAFAISYTIFN